jgi:hypothetical protein
MLFSLCKESEVKSAVLDQLCKITILETSKKLTYFMKIYVMMMTTTAEGSNQHYTL